MTSEINANSIPGDQILPYLDRWHEVKLPAATPSVKVDWTGDVSVSGFAGMVGSVASGTWTRTERSGFCKLANDRDLTSFSRREL